MNPLERGRHFEHTFFQRAEPMRLGPRAAFGRADSRMQEAPRRAWHEAVRVEAVFLEGEPMVVPVQIADAIVLHPVPQDQILCAGRRANRIGLHESQSFDGLP